MERHRWNLALAALLCVTALAYAVPLWNAEFAWDDAALVADNSVTGSLGNIEEIFRSDLWTTTRLPAPPSGYYRPLLLLSLALDRAVFGLSPLAHHLHSLFWHLASVLLLCALLRGLAPQGPALLGAAFFALHPVQSETTALIAARNDSMAAAMLLLCLWLLLPQRVSVPRLLLAGVATAAALLSKESAVLAPAILLALDLARWGRPRGWRRYLPLLAALLAYAGLRWWADVGSAALPGAGNWLLVLEQSPGIIGVYGSLLVWPWPLTPARHVHYLPPLGATMLGCMLAAAVLGAAVWKGRQRRLVLAGLAWAALAFLPTLAATLDKGLLGERYLYLPMAGLALVVAAALPESRRVWRYALPVLLALTGALLLRLPDWKDSATLWTQANRTAPSPFTQAGLAWYLNNQGQYEEALSLVVASIEGNPPYRDACPFLVSIPLQLQRAEEAARLGTWGLEERGCAPIPEFLEPYAVALAGTGRWEEAMAVAQRPELQRPGPGWVVLAAGMLRQGNPTLLQRLAPQWPGPNRFVDQVAKLLRLAGEEVRVVDAPPGSAPPADSVPVAVPASAQPAPATQTEQQD